MHKSTNRKGWIWLLAKTSEGPLLAERLLQQGWCLEVSVSTITAARSYPLSPYLHVQIELLGGKELLIQSVLRTRLQKKRFNWVIDATYPFVLNSVDKLMQECRNLQQPILRLQRSYQPLNDVTRSYSINDLERLKLTNERILPIMSFQNLISLGTLSSLPYFALVPPDPLALQLAISAGFFASRLACLLPFSNSRENNNLEYALCKHWGITILLFCQSGCPSEGLWYETGQQLGIRCIFLRDMACISINCSFSPEELLKIIQ